LNAVAGKMALLRYRIQTDIGVAQAEWIQ